MKHAIWIVAVAALLGACVEEEPIAVPGSGELSRATPDGGEPRRDRSAPPGTGSSSPYGGEFAGRDAPPEEDPAPALPDDFDPYGSGSSDDQGGHDEADCPR